MSLLWQSTFYVDSYCDVNKPASYVKHNCTSAYSVKSFNQKARRICNRQGHRFSYASGWGFFFDVNLFLNFSLNRTFDFLRFRSSIYCSVLLLKKSGFYTICPSLNPPVNFLRTVSSKSDVRATLTSICINSL